MLSTIAKSAALVTLAAATFMTPAPAGAIVSYGASIGAPLYSYPEPPRYRVTTFAYAPFYGSFYETPFGTWPQPVTAPYAAWCGADLGGRVVSIVTLGYDGGYHSCTSY